MEHAVMLDRWRDHQHVRRLHVERPMGDAVGGVEQHSDDQLVIGRGALGADPDIERADAEREIADPDMGQGAAQLAALKLHDLDMRASDGVVESLEAIELAGVDRQVPAHIHAHKCSAVNRLTPSVARSWCRLQGCGFSLVFSRRQASVVSRTEDAIGTNCISHGCDAGRPFHPERRMRCLHSARNAAAQRWRQAAISCSSATACSRFWKAMAVWVKPVEAWVCAMWLRTSLPLTT